MIYSLIYLDVLHSCKRASKFCSFFNIVAILRERKREREKVCVCISFAQYPANLRATVNLVYITYTYIYIYICICMYMYIHIYIDVCIRVNAERTLVFLWKKSRSIADCTFIRIFH